MKSMFNRYAKLYDLFNSKKPYQKEVEFVYSWAGKPMRILDIGCGTADYWKYFPQHTHIIGIERSNHMISQSRYKPLIIRGDITKRRWDKLASFDCATALFDVVNYIPTHKWWKGLPIKKGGYFIFDLWNKEKIDKDGFKLTVRTVNGVTRTIEPLWCDDKRVDLKITIYDFQDAPYTENHRLYLHTMEDVEKFCGKDYEIVDVKNTRDWQTWVKCVKR